MYPDCPSYVECLPFYFFPGIWVWMEKRNNAYETALNLQSVYPIFSNPTVAMWGIRFSAKIFVKSQALHPSSDKLWWLWLWGSNSFLAFVCLLGFGVSSLVGNPSGSHRESHRIKPQLWSCDSDTKWDLRDRRSTSNSRTDSCVLLAKILATDRQDDHLGSKAWCWYD